MIAIMTADGNGLYTVTPLYKGEKFPEFTTIEVKDDGKAIGWVLTGSPKDTQMFDLGTPGKDAVVTTQTTKKIVFKCNR